MDSTQPLSPKDQQTDAHDKDVMAGVQSHDRRALEKLYLTYYGPLARFLSRFVAHTGAVEEIINDSFMTIWMCSKDFRGELRVAAWIFEIVYRTAVQSMGPHSVGGCLSFAEVFRKRNADISENPYIDRFERGLKRLPLEERVTLALAYQMGFSIDEIAAITQVASATVKVRMIQARSVLHHVA